MTAIATSPTDRIRSVVEHVNARRSEERRGQLAAYRDLVTAAVDGKRVDPEKAWGIISALNLDGAQFEADCQRLEERRRAREELDQLEVKAQRLPIAEQELRQVKEDYQAALKAAHSKYGPAEESLLSETRNLSTAIGNRYLHRDKLVNSAWPSEREAISEWEEKFQPLLKVWQDVRATVTAQNNPPQHLYQQMRDLEQQLEALKEQRKAIDAACLEP